MSIEFDKFKKLVEKQHLYTRQHQAELSRLYKICTHEEVVESVDHYSGSYYDTSYSTYNTKCAVCGKILATRDSERGGYG